MAFIHDVQISIVQNDNPLTFVTDLNTALASIPPDDVISVKFETMVNNAAVSINYSAQITFIIRP